MRNVWLRFWLPCLAVFVLLGLPVAFNVVIDPFQRFGWFMPSLDRWTAANMIGNGDGRMWKISEYGRSLAPRVLIGDSRGYRLGASGFNRDSNDLLRLANMGDYYNYSFDGGSIIESADRLKQIRKHGVGLEAAIISVDFPYNNSNLAQSEYEKRLQIFNSSARYAVSRTVFDFSLRGLYLHRTVDRFQSAALFAQTRSVFGVVDSLSVAPSKALRDLVMGMIGRPAIAAAGHIERNAVIDTWQRSIDQTAKFYRDVFNYRPFSIEYLLAEAGLVQRGGGRVVFVAPPAMIDRFAPIQTYGHWEKYAAYARLIAGVAPYVELYDETPPFADRANFEDLNHAKLRLNAPAMLETLKFVEDGAICRNCVVDNSHVPMFCPTHLSEASEVERYGDIVRMRGTNCRVWMHARYAGRKSIGAAWWNVD